ncbi:hypothetical protein ACPV4B_00570 [Vibrio parahaemolyticus]
MNKELQQKIEELLALARLQGVSILGLVDSRVRIDVTFLDR